MTKTIGIDVAKDVLDIACYDGESFAFRHYDGNNQKIFKQFLKDFSIDKQTIVSMEATGVYHLKLAHYLYEQGYQVAVVNPLIIKNYGRLLFKRAQTDKVAAKLIAQHAYDYSPPLYEPRPAQREEMILLLKMLEDLKNTRQQYLNRMASIEIRPKSNKLIKTSLKQLLKSLDKQVQALQKELNHLVKSFAPDSFKRLNDIPGVGPVISTMIIGYYGNFAEFETANQAVAFAGLNPNPRESGKSVRKPARISKKGHSNLRKMLYMGARSARKHNPKCCALYERLRAKGKSHKLALVAVANKLLRQSFAVVKYQRDFDPNYERNSFNSLA